MIRLSKLLVPVDGSPFSLQALRYAADLARGSDAELVVLTVVAGSSQEPPQSFADTVRPMLEGVRHFYTVVRRGTPAVEIERAAQTWGVDAIVMATHGRSGARRLLMGSTTEAVVRQATVPVMVLRPDFLQAWAVPEEAPQPAWISES